jgi:hypothetical protein
MQRSSIIATVVAAGAILVAGSVASVAVINATSSTPPQAQTRELADPRPDAGSQPAPQALAPQAQPTPATTVTPEPLPSITDEPLPELPEVAEPVAVQRKAPAAPAQPKSVTQQSPTKKQGGKSATAKASTKRSTPSPSPTAEVTEISVEQAVTVVLNATNGGVVQNAEKTDRSGFSAWAIRVLRHDGSIITGYVDRVNGVAFDWVVNQEAPKPTAASGSGSSGSGSSSHDDDGHEDGHEHESDHDDD